MVEPSCTTAIAEQKNDLAAGCFTHILNTCQFCFHPCLGTSKKRPWFGESGDEDEW